MKNKYQEALDKIMQINSDDFVDIGGYYAQPKWFKDNINILQELVDKETPMKVVKWKLAQPETRCAKCGAGLERKHDYCWGCGRKLDWSDKDE